MPNFNEYNEIPSKVLSKAFKIKPQNCDALILLTLWKELNKFFDKINKKEI